MSNFGRDLVGNVNCGTANPLMQMVGQMQGMGAQVADVRSFGVTDKGVGGMNVRPEMVRPHTTPMQPESSHFMQAFHQQGPTVNNAIPLHIQQQQRQMQQMQQRMIPQQAGPQAHAPMAAGPDLADQFMQMELQSKEFERAFQQSLPPQQQQPVGGGPDMWAQEFHTRQQAMHQAQQHHQQKMMHAPAPWMQGGMMMGGRPMMGMGMGMMGMGMGMGMGGMSMGMPYMNAQPMQAASSSSSASATVEEVTDEATTVGDQDQEDQPYDYLDGIVNSSSIDEAYKIANQEAELANAPQQGGLGGGMDQEMLNKLMNSDNPKWRNSKFLAFINKISKGEIEFRDNQAFERPAGSAQPSHQDMYGDASSSSNVGADWADEFSVNQSHPASWSDQFANGDQSQAERWMEDYVASGEADTEFKDFDWQRALERAKEDLPSRQDPTYEFSSDNPFTDSADAFQDGVKLFHEGKIKEAILAFEATVAKQADHADAWAYLGEAQAQSEKEQNAIAAFLQCLSIDPYNLKALLQLGVSYTNDLEDHRALNYLKAWMQNNPDYAGVAGMAEQNKEINQYMQFYGSENADSLYTYDNTLHGEVTKMFLNALSVRPDDPDLHTVLGVLYHISSDFDKSIEAFKNAVKLKPDDPALWNKLGATQANSSRSADAVHAYKRALQLRPTFVRALSNLAISYANQGLHEDAVRTYLTTLTHNPDANHVWSYLRISLSNLGRDELVELSQQRNVELFRPFFQF